MPHDFMKKNSKEMVGTFVFVAGICVVALAILFYSKALDSESTTMKFNAESVCFIGGHYDDLEKFEFKGNHTYIFKCDDKKSTVVEFDGTSGVIRYVDSKNK